MPLRLQHATQQSGGFGSRHAAHELDGENSDVRILVAKQRRHEWRNGVRQ